MRLVYFSNEYTTHDWRYLNKLAQLVDEVHYLRLCQGEIQLEKRPLPDGVRLTVLSNYKNTPDLLSLFRLAPKVKKVLNEIKPDVVHCGPIQTCGFLTALVGFRPMLLMSWGSDLLRESEKNFFWKATTRYTLKNSQAIFLDTLTGKKKVYELVKNYPEDHILVFPWGVDLDLFQPRNSPVRQQLGWQNNLVLISTRSWEPIYGVDVILMAFLNVIKIVPEARLLLLGTGSKSHQIHRFIEENNLKKFVYIAGQIPQDKLPDYYNSSDIYVSASYSDGTSVSLLEAMACGLVVVVSDINTNREWIASGVNGYLFHPGEFKELTCLLLECLRNINSVREMGAKNRQITCLRANWNKNFQSLVEMYQRIIRENE